MKAKAKNIEYQQFYINLIQSVLQCVKSSDFDNAIDIIERFKEYCIESNDELGEITYNLAYFILHKYQSNTDKSNQFLVQTESLINKVENDLFFNKDIRFLKQRFYNFKCVYLFENQQYDIAIIYNKKVIELSKQLNDKRFECNALVNLGFLYDAEKQYVKAKEVFEKALFISEQLEEFRGKNNIYNGLSLANRNLKDFEKAFYFSEKSIVAAIIEGNTRNLPHYLCSQAYSCLENEILFQKAEEIIRKLKDVVFKGSIKHSELVYYNVNCIEALYHLKKKAYQKVINILSKYENEALTVNDEFIRIRIFDYLTQAYINLDNSEKAQKCYHIVKELQEEGYHNARKIYFQRQSDYLNILYTEMDQGKETLEKEIDLRLKAERNNVEILNLTRKTAAQKRELEELNKSLEHFSRMVAHDLKEPLRTMRSFSQILIKKEGGKLNGSSVELLNYIVDGGKRMEDMISSILEFTRIGFSKVEHHKVNLDDIVHQTVYDLSAQINRSNAKVIIENSFPEVSGVKETLKLLFQNLISNALKFIDTSKSPEIILGLKRENEKIVYYISDNGIGIREEDKKRVFDTFTRLNSKSKYEGSGLGLATCQKIIQQHNGEIWIESELGKGTTFFFTINTNTDL